MFLLKVKQFAGDKLSLTALCPNLKDVDPDDAFSSVPYEKGFNFLYFLETLVGGPGNGYEQFMCTFV